MPMTDAELAVDVLRAMTNPDRVEDFLGYLTDDATWTIPGDWPRISGVQRRPSLDKFVRHSMPAGFPTGCELDVHHVYSDGEGRFVVEFTSRAVTSKDREYVNEYCFAVEIADGKVSALREYMDTLYTHRVLHT